MVMLRLLSAVCIVTLAAGDAADQFLDWECPGLPCFVVNYYESRDYKDIKQTCTSITEISPCLDLENGVAFSAVDSDGSVLGTHDVDRPHPCTDRNYLCKQQSCIQGSLTQCNSYCSVLNLLDLYNSTCYSYCAAECG